VVAVPFSEQIMSGECKLVRSASCCDCREIMWKIMEQVKAESDQWTEMQDMLEQVRLEMQELQSIKCSNHSFQLSVPTNIDPTIHFS
jgi:hypothetical protein